jgi:hypothetical protein
VLYQPAASNPVDAFAVYRDALDAVAPQLQRLAQLEDDYWSTQQQQQQQRQASAQDSRECLTAIGAHIEGGRWPAWMEGFIRAKCLWEFVSKATGHRMGGEQLARLFGALQQQEQQQQQQQQQQQARAEGVGQPPAPAASGVCTTAHHQRVACACA